MSASLDLADTSARLPADVGAADPRLDLVTLLRDLRTDESGLGSREAAHRLTVHGPNSLTRRQARRWPRELAAQFTQPLALLLAVAAVLAWASGSPALSWGVGAVIVLNAAFAFVQERQAEHAVNALSAYLPATARVVRDGRRSDIPAVELVPGDILVVTEGDLVCADGRVLAGELELDQSALTGESVSVSRSAEPDATVLPLFEARELVFSGTTCTSGDARVVVTRTGMHTELGRIAVLSQRGTVAPSPLEVQVRRVTWVIAGISVVIGAAFIPLGLAAGLGWAAAISFAIGLIVANVPEGLLPTITLALAAGVRELARHGAVVKRLAAVETLGSVTVICTDKTGTLTQNSMHAVRVWTAGGEYAMAEASADGVLRELAAAAAACTTAEAPRDGQAHGRGDPTELALLRLAADLGVGTSDADRDRARRRTFGFDAHLQRMTTVDAVGESMPAFSTVHMKGAPERVLACCTGIREGPGLTRPLDAPSLQTVQATLESYAAQGLRVLAVGTRDLGAGDPAPSDRTSTEADLVLLGLVALLDPPREAVPAAVAAAHGAGVRVHVITGDFGPTAATIARSVGIGSAGSAVVTGPELDRLGDAELDALLSHDDEIVFARVSPEGKLRICQALQHVGQVVAMTGDGVNDAPALRHADIGVAMGRSGTDVAREAATMLLTDDDFSTIVAAIAAGRQVFDNVRKFVLYIFAHAVPEVVPFLVFALSGGAVPLPLTVLQILAIDLGTETLPALALGREPAEKGAMDRPPRSRGTGVIDRALLTRAWLQMGSISAALVMGAFLVTMWRAGWSPGDPTGGGTALHHAYLQATTMSFAGIVACQIGTAFAARTDRESLFTVGLFSNRLLLWGIVFELTFTAALVYLPFLQDIFGTAALGPTQVALLLPFPVIVWGADELIRLRRRRKLLAVSSSSSGRTA